MPRSHKRVAGSHNYKSYTDEALSKAVREVKAGSLSMRKASKLYKIPFGTLHKKLNNKHSKKADGQQRLSQELENQITNADDVLSDWKIYLSGIDIRQLVKSYLDSPGVTDATFNNNLPGIHWLNFFIRRRNLTPRLCQNVKSSRVEINLQTLTDYFDNLEATFQSIRPEHAYNYVSRNRKLFYFADRTIDKNCMTNRRN